MTVLIAVCRPAGRAATHGGGLIAFEPSHGMASFSGVPAAKSYLTRHGRVRAAPPDS
ncbi:MAG: hypothetical protein M5U29_03120 [Anaerolineae bacterium]|nr:hypothetical protein [Anaerolineae bacterium]